MNVLLLEPDVVLARLYSAALKAAEFQVQWRQTGQAAIKCIDDLFPDLIIMELQLRGHNGMAFLYELRSYTDLRNIPVILNSSVPPDLFTGADKAFSSFGVTSYLYKPATSIDRLVEHAQAAISLI